MESAKKNRTSPAAARFRQLLGRALFELRLAGDVARAEGYGGDVTSLIEGSKRNLHTCLRRTETGKTQTESREL